MLSHQNLKMVSKNTKEAAKLYEMAARKGHATSGYNLALCYRDGIGVEQNLKKAFKWFLWAAAYWEQEAASDLGYCYHEGEGTKRNFKAAVYWYRVAAKSELYPV